MLPLDCEVDIIGGRVKLPIDISVDSINISAFTNFSKRFTEAAKEQSVEVTATEDTQQNNKNVKQEQSKSSSGGILDNIPFIGNLINSTKLFIKKLVITLSDEYGSFFSHPFPHFFIFKFNNNKKLCLVFHFFKTISSLNRTTDSSDDYAIKIELSDINLSASNKKETKMTFDKEMSFGGFDISLCGKSIFKMKGEHKITIGGVNRSTSLADIFQTIWTSFRFEFSVYIMSFPQNFLS